MARLKQTQVQIDGKQGQQAAYQTRGSQGRATTSKPKKGKKRK